MASATPPYSHIRLWLDTGERQYPEGSMLYNEDDCLATRLIKDWLAGGPAADSVCVRPNAAARPPSSTSFIRHGGYAHGLNAITILGLR